LSLEPIPLKGLMFIVVAILLAALTAGAATTPVLPDQFAGWKMSGKPVISQDATKADPAFAPLLKEYGFTDLETGTYTKPGRGMRIRAARFADASGAYGAFTFYRQPEMTEARIGDQGASSNLRILFYRGNILVDTVLDRATAMSAAELRELADSLPRPSGGLGKLPNLPNYLPTEKLVPGSRRYIVGPVGLSDASAPLPADVVGFSRGAEVALGRYGTSGGQATLMVLSYPTPQIATERLRAIEASLGISGGTSSGTSGRSASGQNGSSDDRAGSGAKRSGPLVAVVWGQVPTSEADSLLAGVNYDAEVTWNQNTFLGRRNNLANLLVGIIILVAILVGGALVSGILFGGFRVLMKRLLPGRLFDRSKDGEIISLHLRE
jgi:hypothetical protein